MPPQPEEQTLIRQAVAGDPTALASLLRRHYDPLVRHIRGRLGAALRDSIDPEDVVQEVHVEVFRSVNRFQPQGDAAFFGWLATLADRRLIDRARARQAAKRGGDRKRVRANSCLSVDTLIHVLAVDDQTPSRIMAKQDGRIALRVALAGLKPEYREALRLRYDENLPVAEIARQMGRTERAIHMLCNRGLKRLRDAIDTTALRPPSAR
jgi:RNA polymerase sigma-70 factor (ECF subfamily)